MSPVAGLPWDWHPNPLPAKVTQDVVTAWVTAFGPRLKFHRDERHFPSTAHRFRVVSRFRDSRQGARDNGWNRESRAWVRGNHRHPEYFDAPPDHLVEQTALRTGAGIEVEPGTRFVLRPWDSRRIGPRKEGLFLERDDRIQRVSSGHVPVGGTVKAPMYLDAVMVQESSVGPYVKVLCWFFYELNLWHGLLTHEGDWEHVSYIVRLAALEAGDPPTHVYFAQHNTGEVRRFDSLGFVPGTTHPVMYVDRHGHPTKPAVGDAREYTSLWDTWGEVRWLRNEAWKEYSGAWGEVGETVHTTGPLGPWFKQGRDLVRVRRRPDGSVQVRRPRR